MTIETLQQLWNASIGEHPLSVDQAEMWLVLHTEEIIRKGVQTTISKWQRENHTMSEDYLLRYTSKTMNNAKTRMAVAQSARSEVSR